MTTQEILQGVHDWTNGKIVYDISVAHPDGQGNPTKYADLTAALGTGGANIPEALRKGGMSVKFVLSSDNKYVQFRYMSSSTAVADFINVANWQGVDSEPTAGSDNLVESNGTFEATDNVSLVSTELYLGSINSVTGAFNYNNHTRATSKYAKTPCAFSVKSGYKIIHYAKYNLIDGNVVFDELTAIANYGTSSIYISEEDCYAVKIVVLKDDGTSEISKQELKNILDTCSFAYNIKIAEINKKIDEETYQNDINKLLDGLFVFNTDTIHAKNISYNFSIGEKYRIVSDETVSAGMRTVTPGTSETIEVINANWTAGVEVIFVPTENANEFRIASTTGEVCHFTIYSEGVNERISKNTDSINKINWEINGGECEFTDKILLFTNLNSPEIVSAIGQYEVVGINQVDGSDVTNNSVKNDRGTVTSDNSSSFFNRYIPVYGKKTIISNKGMQRVYLYDINKNWLGRTDKDNNRLSFTADNYSVAYVQIQIKNTSLDSFCATYKEFGDSDYEPFVEYTQSYIRPPFVLSSTDLAASNFKVVISAKPLLFDGGNNISGEYPVWEPLTTTDEYICDNGYENAYIDINFTELLQTYFDIYLINSPQYSVVKKTLGQDSAETYDEIFYYEFIPKNYRYTVILSAGMNPCELSPIFGLAYFVKSLMENSGNDIGLATLKNCVRFIILPVLCPSSFDQSPCLYTNINGVRINKNFNYIKSWDNIAPFNRGTKGTFPDSEVETKALKRLLSVFTACDLWIDCHADLRNYDSAKDVIFQTILSDNSITSKVVSAQNKMIAFYTDKGYIPTPSPYLVWNNVALITEYPKHLYSWYNMKIHSIMIEQFSSCNGYGGVRDKQCDSYSIKNYVSMLRQYILEVLKD